MLLSGHIHNPARFLIVLRAKSQQTHFLISNFRVLPASLVHSWKLKQKKSASAAIRKTLRYLNSFEYCSLRSQIFNKMLE